MTIITDAPFYRPRKACSHASDLLDEKRIYASAWEPYQELFQGVARCLHSDFRIGGLAPGETKKIRGKMYLVSADVDELLARYARDFPEHGR